MSSRSFKSQNRGKQVTVKPKNQNMNKAKNPPKKKRRNRRRNAKNVGLNSPINRPLPFGGRDSKIVPFREQLGSVNGTDAFQSLQFSLNPGQASTFPWLAKEAAQWEKYRWRRLCFHYTPQVNEFAENNKGTILLSVDTDASDPAPVDLQHALDIRPSSRGQLPAREFSFDVPVKMLNQKTDGYFVRPGNLPGGSDIKTYDCGNLFLTTVGNYNTDLCGYITVDYEVEFFIPVLESDIAPKNNSYLFCADTNATSLTTTVASVLPSNVISNGIGVVNNAGVMTLTTGNYLCIGHVNFLGGAQNITSARVDLYDVTNSAILASGYLTSNALLGNAVGTDFVYVLSVSGSLNISLKATATFATSTCTATGKFSVLSI